MTLQARFSIILSLIALLALITFSWVVQNEIAEFQKKEIDNQLLGHLNISQVYIDDVINNIQSDLDLISHDRLTRQYFSVDESIRYQLFHSEITGTLERYRFHSPLYSEIAIILPDGFKEIYVARDKVDVNNEVELFLESVIHSFAKESSTYEYVEIKPGSGAYLVAYQPIYKHSSLISTAKNSVEAYLKISVRLTDLINQIKSDNVEVVFHHGDSSTSLEGITESVYHPENDDDSTKLHVEILPDLTLHVTLHHEDIEAQASQLFRQSLLLIALSVFSLIFATIALLKYVIIHPIKNFTEVMQKSDIDQHAKKKWVAYEKNEFGTLKEQFDSLMHRVKNSSVELKRQAFTDTLTGLPNRASLYDLLQRQIQNGTCCFSVLFIDLDGFKQVNDIYGHEAGDEMLIEVAYRLSEVVSDTIPCKVENLAMCQNAVFRLGGDEFMVVVMSQEQTEKVADQILQVLKNAISIDDKLLYTGASIGIANYPSDAEKASLLIQQADLAMYYAKSSGKMRYCRFNQQMSDEEKLKLKMEETVREGIEFDRFEANFQPKINSTTGMLTGFESLARLRDSQDQLVSPVYFIKTAQSTGVLEYITYIVTEHTCQLLAAMNDSHLIASINISPNQLNDFRLMADIRMIMWRYEISPRQIEFEVTEEELMTNFETARTDLELIRSFGFRTSLDDFGSGYSSLGQLKKFQFDTLKLDRVFVATEDYNSDMAVGVVSSIKSLADFLNMEIVAEGIETEEQLKFINSFGIHIIQGYFYSKPLTLEQFLSNYKSVDD